MLVPGLHVHTRAGITQCIYYLTPRLPRLLFLGSAAPAGSLWLCYCSRRLKAARKQNRPPRLEKLLFGKKRRRLHVDRRGNGWWGAVVIKTKIIPKLRRCCWCKKNKAAEAPGSGDSASRRSCTGKSATKAGRFPLLGISGTLVPASVGM